MRLIGVAVVKNEADIIEASVRGNLELLDHLVVLEHGSTDATPGILLELKKEGLPLTLVDGAGVAFNQATITTGLMRRALAMHEGDVGIPLDADEILVAPGRGELEAGLAAIGAHGVGSLRWRTYVPPAEPEPPMHPLRSARLRCRDDVDSGLKAVVPRALAERQDWSYSSGNHTVLRPGDGGPRVQEARPIEQAGIAHVPFRSAAQLTNKVLVGYFARRLMLRERMRTTGLSFQFRSLFDRLMRGERFGPADVQRAALEYYVVGHDPARTGSAHLPALVEDPLPVRSELRYTPDEPPDALAALALWMDRLMDSMLQQPAPQGGAPAA